MTLLDPIYEVDVACPVCNDGDITSFGLKSKCQMLTYDDLSIPIYTGIKGHADADFLDVAATVCPNCLYASTQPGSFTRLGGMLKTPPVVLSDALQEKLLLTSQDRRHLLTAWRLEVDDFGRPRSTSAAYVAYLLVAQSAAVKGSFRIGRAMAEVAAANLFASRYAERIGPEEHQRALVRAAAAYNRVFETSDHDPADTEDVIYTCVALYLRLERLSEVTPYLRAIDRLERKARHADSQEARRIRRVYDRIRDIWRAAGGGDWSSMVDD